MASSLGRLRLSLGRTAFLRPTTTPLVQYNALGTSFGAFSTAPKAAEQQVVVDLPSDANNTAGKVLNYLNTSLHNSNDTPTITNAHIQALVESCTSTDDLPSLLHAITTFKRTQEYVMDTPTADLMIDKVLALNNGENNSISGALWVLENFKPRTGLYYSATVYKLDQALNQLHASIVIKDNEEVDKDQVWKALERVVQNLIQRKTRQGGRGLSKRKKKDYLKCLQTKGGPTQTTVRRVAEIGTHVKGVEETITALIKPFQAANVSIHPATLEWLEQEQNGDNEEEDESESEEASDESAEADAGEQEEKSEEEEKKEE